MPNLTLNGTEFYDAPKNGGTTVRMWSRAAEGALDGFDGRRGYYNLVGIGLPSTWRDNVTRDPQFFRPGAADALRWCIKRDPVDRFVSAYTDKILRERLADWSVDDALGMILDGTMATKARSTTPERGLACHFLGQTWWFGPDPAFFHRVFDVTRMDEARAICATEVFRCDLPDLHARRQADSGIDKVTLSPDQRRRAETAHAADYEAGWH